MSDSTTQPITVDIWSDVACPWCYIGLRRFAEGAAAFRAAGEGRDVVVEYHSYELSPDTPVDFEGGEADFLAAHKGIPAEQVTAMLERVTAVAASVGLTFDYDSLHHTNTVPAHQLLHYAKAHGRQAQLLERLFRSYFTEGGQVGRVADLADLAGEVGLDRVDAARALESGEYLDAVRADEQQAREYGIPGVPFYVLEGRYGVSGAQEPQIFAQALEQVWSERVPA